MWNRYTSFYTRRRGISRNGFIYRLGHFCREHNRSMKMTILIALTVAHLWLCPRCIHTYKGTREKKEHLAYVTSFHPR